VRRNLATTSWKQQIQPENEDEWPWQLAVCLDLATNSPAKGPALVVGEATQARIALLAGVFGRTPRVARAIAKRRAMFHNFKLSDQTVRSIGAFLKSCPTG